MTDPSPYAPWPKTSHWSEIAAACRPDSPDNGRAVESLCLNFRTPVYAYFRREGFSHDEAQDLAQEFFLFLLAEGQPLAGYDRRKSRFRTFLLAVLKNFTRSHRRYATAQKRGGGQAMTSIDQSDATTANLAGSGPSPEVEYTRAWADALIAGVVAILREEYAPPRDRIPVEPLLARMVEGKSVSYEEMAVELGMTAGALRVAAMRLRDRFKTLIRREIGRTVPNDEEVDDEVRELFAAYSPKRHLA